MSLIINSVQSSPQWNLYGDSQAEESREAELLDRYLAIMETNKKSSRFVPDDALLALDMAGFVTGRLANPDLAPQVSAARLALALVQPQHQAVIQ